MHMGEYCTSLENFINHGCVPLAELSLIVYCALQNMKTRERTYTMADKGNKESATPNRQSETRMSTHAVRRF